MGPPGECLGGSTEDDDACSTAALTPSKRPSAAQAAPRRKQARSAVSEDVASKQHKQGKERVAPGRRLAFDHEEPNAIHKLIGYSREGDDATLAPDKLAVYDFIVRTCDVPDDFESNHKYGPKSGVTYEERLINAFCYALFPVAPRAEDLRPKLRRLVARRRWADASALVVTSA